MVFFTCEPLVSMVFQWFFYIWTIGVNGFSMFFLHVNHWWQWFFQWFCGSQPLVSMVFQMVFLQSNHCHWMNGLWLTIDFNGWLYQLGKPCQTKSAVFWTLLKKEVFFQVGVLKIHQICNIYLNHQNCGNSASTEKLQFLFSVWICDNIIERTSTMSLWSMRMIHRWDTQDHPRIN